MRLQVVNEDCDRLPATVVWHPRSSVLYRSAATQGLKDDLGACILLMMPVSEAARHDLYTGLAELLGSDRAETLMTHLPRYDPAEVATKADITNLESMLNIRLDGMNKRLDRLFLTLVAGLFVIVAAMTSVFFATI